MQSGQTIAVLGWALRKASICLGVAGKGLWHSPQIGRSPCSLSITNTGHLPECLMFGDAENARSHQPMCARPQCVLDAPQFRRPVLPSRAQSLEVRNLGADLKFDVRNLPVTASDSNRL